MPPSFPAGTLALWVIAITLLVVVIFDDVHF
jgi:hypothetical protein